MIGKVTIPTLLTRLLDLERRLAYLEANSGLRPLSEYQWFLPAPMFVSSSGAPAQGTLGASTGRVFSTWDMDDNTLERVTSQWRAPWTGNIEITAFYAMVSAAAGDVRIGINRLAVADGEVCTAAGTASTVDVTVPGTAAYLDIATLLSSEAVTAVDLVRLTFQRNGNAAEDTAAGDLQFLGLGIQYV